MKTDFQLNAMADSIFNEMAQHITPQEAITVLGITFLMMYERCDWQPKPSIEKFTSDIREGLLKAWTLRTLPHQPPSAVQ